MIECIVTIVVNILNALGIFLWAWVSMLAMEVIVCKNVKTVGVSGVFTKMLSRRLCYTVAKVRRRFKVGVYTDHHLSSIVLLAGCYVVIYYRLTELTYTVRVPVDFWRTLASILIPLAFILSYRFNGIRISLFK